MHFKFADGAWCSYHVNYAERLTDVEDGVPKWEGEKGESELFSPPVKEKTA